MQEHTVKSQLLQRAIEEACQGREDLKDFIWQVPSIPVHGTGV